MMIKSIHQKKTLLMKKLILWIILLALCSGCSRGFTGCAAGGMTGASVGARAAGAIVFGTLVGCTVGFNL
jgi:hypothetical protein